MGESIAQIRRAKSISKQEIASLCDFEKSNMSRREAGNTKNDNDEPTQIAVALDVSLAELLSIHEATTR